MIAGFYQRLHKVISTSQEPAYAYYSERYSYSELYSLMKKINYHLSSHRHKKVVLLGSKSIGMYAAIYSIILSGNIWVPFTPEFPVQRLQEMLDILKADIIIFEGEFPEQLKAIAAKSGITVMELNALLASGKEKEFGSFDFAPEDLAYIMFTSGSTGKPKGVPVTHENYINFIHNALTLLPFKKGDIFSDYHDFAFDISIFYLFCAPLVEGALSPIRNNEEKIFPVKHFTENRISVWSSVPSVISRIQRLRPQEEVKNYFRILFLCGEPFSLEVLRYCYQNLKADKVYNFYGLTETGVENFYHPCSLGDLTQYQDKGFVPIGQPLPGNKIMVSADKELLIAGCQLTPGYLQGIESRRFEVIDGERWYHTGDIIERYLDVYFCKGRVDSQVKLSGYRIELMDIEVHVRRFAGVKEAVCFIDDTGSTRQLVCALEPHPGAVVDIQGLKIDLLKRLPDYMVPKKIEILQEMPRNNNGKLDRRKIKEMYFSQLV